MRYDTTELILAAHIREIAHASRSIDRNLESEGANNYGIKEQALDEHLHNWDREHPIEDYLEAALQELKSIADTVDSLRKPQY